MKRPKPYPSKLKAYGRALRNDPTQTEKLLWQCIRRRQVRGYLFLRQKPIPPFIVDFYCHKLRLVIEVDGKSHIGKEEADKKRQIFIQNTGLNFLRFTDNEVKENLDGVVRAIENYIELFEKGKLPSHGPESPCIPLYERGNIQHLK